MKKNAVLATCFLVFASNTLSAKVIDYSKMLSIEPTYGADCILKTKEQGENVMMRLAMVKMNYKLKHECNINFEGNNDPVKAVRLEIYVHSQISLCYSKSDATNIVDTSEATATGATAKCKLTEAAAGLMETYSKLLNTLPDQ